MLLESVIIITISFVVMIIVGYFGLFTMADKIMIFLIPFSILAIFIYQSFNVNDCVKHIIKIIAIIMMFMGIILFFVTNNKLYAGNVFQTNIIIIWTVIITSIIVFGTNNRKTEYISIIKIILFTGLIIMMLSVYHTITVFKT